MMATHYNVKETVMGKDGRDYKSTGYIQNKYSLGARELEYARNNGMPYISFGRRSYYNEDDLHDYYSGRIGKDVD